MNTAFLTLQYSTTDKAGCKVCKEKILFYVLRIGVISSGSWGGMMTSWHHLSCFKITKKWKDIDPKNITGFKKLTNDDKKMVKEHFSSLTHFNKEGIAEILQKYTEKKKYIIEIDKKLSLQPTKNKKTTIQEFKDTKETEQDNLDNQENTDNHKNELAKMLLDTLDIYQSKQTDQQNNQDLQQNADYNNDDQLFLKKGKKRAAKREDHQLIILDKKFKAQELYNNTDNNISTNNKIE